MLVTIIGGNQEGMGNIILLHIYGLYILYHPISVAKEGSFSYSEGCTSRLCGVDLLRDCQKMGALPRAGGLCEVTVMVSKKWDEKLQEPTGSRMSCRRNARKHSGKQGETP